MKHEPAAAGDPRHPDHERWLLELGRATYAAAEVANICFNVLRIYRGTSSQALYDDALGALINRLRPLLKSHTELPGLEDFLLRLEYARTIRNDLLHALPVRDGLYRRRSKDGQYVRRFFDIASLEFAAEELSSVAREGNTLLYHDGGASVRAWYEAGGS